MRKMRKMRTKEEIEFEYERAKKQMYCCNDIACKEECESIKKYYIELRNDYAEEVRILGWVLGKDGY